MLVRKTNTSALTNIHWLQELCRAKYTSDNEVITLNNHWVAEPRVVPQSFEGLRNLANQLKPSTELLALCDVTNEEYNKSLSSAMSNWPLTLIAFKGISKYVMADVITKLDFSKVKKIGLCNLDNLTLWLLFSKLVCWEMNGNHNILVFFGSGISDNWQKYFKSIKTEMLPKIYSEISPLAFGDLIHALNKINGLKIKLSYYQQEAGVTLTQAHEAVIREKDELILKLTNKNTELADANKKIFVLNQRIDAATNKITELTKTNALEAELNKLKEKNALSEQEIIDRNSKLAKAQEQIDLEISKYQTSQLELATAKEHSQRLSADISQLHNDIEYSKLFASDETQSLRDEKQKMSDEYENQQTQLKIKISETSQQLKKKIAEATKLLTENEALIQKVAILIANEKGLLAQVANLTQSVTTLTAERDSLATSLTATKDELAINVDHVKTLEETLNDLEKEHVALLATTNIHTATAATLNSTVETLTKENSQLKKEKSKLKRLLEQANNTLAIHKIYPETSSEQESDDEEKEHSPKRKRPRHHEKSSKSLQREVKELRSQLNAANIELTMLHEQRTALEKLNVEREISYFQTNKEKTKEKVEAEKNLVTAKWQLDRMLTNKKLTADTHAQAIAKLEEEKAALQKELTATKIKIKEEMDMDSMFAKVEHPSFRTSATFSPLANLSIFESALTRSLSSPAVTNHSTLTFDHSSIPLLNLDGFKP